MDISGLFEKIVPITQFNKGQASPLFSRAQKGETLLVVKNNSPVAVVLSLEEYKILRAFPKICNKLTEVAHDDCSKEMSNLLEQLKMFDENGD